MNQREEIIRAYNI